MSTQTLKGTLIPRHDIEANWNKAKNFTPAKDELIIYDKDDTFDFKRYKMGDGETKVTDLSFAPVSTKGNNVILNDVNNNKLFSGNYQLISGSSNTVGYSAERVTDIVIGDNECVITVVPYLLPDEYITTLNHQFDDANDNHMILWYVTREKVSSKYLLKQTTYRVAVKDLVKSTTAPDSVSITIDNIDIEPYPITESPKLYQGYIGISDVPGTYAPCSRSLIVGADNTLYGSKSLLSGQTNTLYSDSNLVGGNNNTVYCNGQLVAGSFLVGNRTNQSVIGSYNAVDKDAVFIVGNGDPVTRKNAFVVKDNNTAYVDGKKLATEEYVHSAISDSALVFDTKAQLDAWLGKSKNICPVPLEVDEYIEGTDENGDGFIDDHTVYKLHITVNEDGTFNYESINTNGDTIATIPVKPDTQYVFSSNVSIFSLYCDDFIDENQSFTVPSNVTEVHIIAPINPETGNRYKYENVWIQVEEGDTPTEFTPHSFNREDGLTIESLNEGDKLVTTSPTYTEYIWNGSEAIPVELPESGVGRETTEGGEIFNDYENNQARTPKSSARGEGTVAGGKGFLITNLQSKGNLLNNNDYTLSFNKESQATYTASTTKNFTIYLYPSNYKIGLRTPFVNVADNYHIKVTKTYYNTEAVGNVTEIVIDTQVYPGLQFIEINEDAFNLDTTDSLVKFDIEMKLLAAHDANREPYKDYICLYDTATTEDPNDSTYTNFCTTPPTGKYYLAEESDMSSFKVNDEISVRIKSNYDNLGKVTNIVSDNDTRYIEVNNFTTGTATTLTNAYLWLPVMPEDWSTYDPGNITSLKATRKIDAGTTYMDAAQYAEGSETYAIKYAAHAEGNRSVAAGRWSHAEGNGTYAAYGAHSEGVSTKALGQQSHAENSHTEAQGFASHAEGGYTTANGGYSHTEGFQTQANADFAHAEGQESIASEKCAHAEGYKTTASGVNSHSEGNQTIASGVRAHAEGVQTQATGANAHSEGSNTQATGDNSHARGYYSRAVGLNSVASGHNSVAEGDNSIASGYYCNTSKDAEFSLAHGDHAQVGIVTDQQAKWGIALGEYVVTDANHQIAIGRYNKVSDRSLTQRPIFMVGYGSSNTNRKNNFTVFRNGVARVGADPIVDMDVATKKYVDNKMRFMTQSEFDDIDTSTLTAGTVVFITE